VVAVAAVVVIVGASTPHNPMGLSTAYYRDSLPSVLTLLSGGDVCVGRGCSIDSSNGSSNSSSSNSNIFHLLIYLFYSWEKFLICRT
jgi:hypothetical protein